MKPLRIAFFGSRGIPACYSGFETFVEQMAVRLVQRGHHVTVYNRVPFNPYRGSEFKGVRLVHLPTLRLKGTDTIVHTFLSVLHAATQGYDIAYICGVGNALFSIPLRVLGARTLINVDGADFARAKWTGFGRWWLRQSETWAARLSDRVIADNICIQNRYRDEYQTEAILIPYGANVIESDPGTGALEQFKLRSDGYFLYVSRLVPENEAVLAVRAYLKSGVKLPLVIVGDAPYVSDYIRELHHAAEGHPEVILTGYQFGLSYQQLSYHARAFVLPTAIDATRPVLLDQMAAQGCVIVRDTPGNLAVVGDTAFVFEHGRAEDSLAEAYQRAEQDLDAVRDKRALARERIRTHFDWEVLTGRYEEEFHRLRQTGGKNAL
jgi:glycosyltransferase involved in cell wall biosynthesis